LTVYTKLATVTLPSVILWERPGSVFRGAVFFPPGYVRAGYSYYIKTVISLGFCYDDM